MNRLTLNIVTKYFESFLNNNMYINSVELIADENPLKKGIKIEFKSPVCFIVGDNGVGKSTLLECIGDYFGKKDDTYLKRQCLKNSIIIDKSSEFFNFNYLDFHSDDKKFAGSFGDNMSLQIGMMKASSGQVSIGLLNNTFKNIDKVRDGLVILDEPCRGQSIKNSLKLANMIRVMSTKLNCQVILTTHSDWILKAFKDTAQYYDITNNADTTYKDYILSQLS